MRTIFLFITLAFSATVFSQSADVLERKIQQLIVAGAWDDVILQSTDLSIEDPLSGKGYYYTAMAFMKLNDFEKAGEWLTKAESFKNPLLQDNLLTLKAAIEDAKGLHRIKISADKQQHEGNSLEAAEKYHRLWAADSSNTELAVAAIENYFENKLFLPAWEILNSPQMLKDKEADVLRNRIAGFKVIKDHVAYQNAMAGGHQYFKSENYEQALEQFNTALRHKSFDEEALQYALLSKDEVNWAKTTRSGTIDAYSTYLSEGKNLKYKSEAERVLKGMLYSRGNEAAKNNRLSEMEQYFSSYKRNYANAAEQNAVNKIMAEAYAKAAIASISKTGSNHSTVLQYFDRSLELDNNKKTEADKAKYLKHYNKITRPNYGYLALVYDSTTNFGLSIGGLKNKNIGVYFTLRANKDVFNFSDITIDNSLKTEGLQVSDGYVNYAHENKAGLADAVFGLTKKIVYPLWIYGGGGVTYSQTYFKLNEMNIDNTLRDTHWARNTDEMNFKPMAEAGLIINVHPLHLRGGVKTNEFKEFNRLYYSVGIGFSWK